MDWVLFLQIEVLLLTVGLVMAFVISSRQTTKDNSFFKRVAALGAAFSSYGKSLTEKETNINKTHEEILKELTDAIKQSKKEKEE